MTTILVFLMVSLSLVNSQGDVEVSDGNLFSTISNIFANMLSLLQEKPEILERDDEMELFEDSFNEETKFSDSSVSDNYITRDSNKKMDEMFSQFKYNSFVGGQRGTLGLTPEDVAEQVMKVEQILEEYNKVE